MIKTKITYKDIKDSFPKFSFSLIRIYFLFMIAMTLFFIGLIYLKGILSYFATTSFEEIFSIIISFLVFTLTFSLISKEYKYYKTSRFFSLSSVIFFISIALVEGIKDSENVVLGFILFVLSLIGLTSSLVLFLIGTMTFTVLVTKELFQKEGDTK